VFKILADNSKKTLEPLSGALHGILVSDRAKALNFWAMERRQICWAHLLREFVSFSERADRARRPVARFRFLRAAARSAPVDRRLRARPVRRRRRE
jgi:hypothetical protein